MPREMVRHSPIMKELQWLENVKPVYFSVPYEAKMEGLDTLAVWICAALNSDQIKHGVVQLF